MYAVVETRNGLGHKEVCVVLTSWINNDHTYWPPNYYKALKKMLSPDSTWTQHSCVVLKRNLATYAEAKEKEKFLADNSCSEVDEGATNHLPIKYNFNNEFQKNSNVSELNGNPSSRNSNIIVLNDESEKHKNIDATEEYMVNNGKVSEPLQNFDNELPTPENLEYLSLNHSTPAVTSKILMPTPLIFKESHEPNISSKEQTTINEKLNEIYNEMKIFKNISEHQTKLITEQTTKIEALQNELATINRTLETFVTSTLAGIQKTKKNSKNTDFIYPVVPIKTVEELNLLNAKLNENFYMEQMIIRLHKFRTPNVNKSIKQMFEHLLCYSVIKLYSWTGQSGIAKGINKLIFMDLNNIIQLAENTLNYLNIDAPVTMDETKKAVQQFLKRSTIVMARSMQQMPN